MKIIKHFLILGLIFLIQSIYAQGTIFIAKKDGLKLSMDIEYYNSVQDACYFQQGDQYKVTIYLANESGKKIKSDLTYLPQVIINAPDGECGDYNWNVEFDLQLPLNPGDVESVTKYYVIKSGKMPSTIIPSQWVFRGYKFVEE